MQYETISLVHGFSDSTRRSRTIPRKSVLKRRTWSVRWSRTSSSRRWTEKSRSTFASI